MGLFLFEVFGGFGRLVEFNLFEKACLFKGLFEIILNQLIKLTHTQVSFIDTFSNFPEPEKLFFADVAQRSY